MSKIITIEGAHEILMRQLPEWFKPILEYIAIMEAYALPLSSFQNVAEQIRNNFFIQTCDEATLQYWERILGLTIQTGDTLDYRRQRIMMRFNQVVPYTVWTLKDKLTELYGNDYTLDVNEEENWIKIFVTSDVHGAVNMLFDLIHNYVPTHLYVYSNQQVTNYVRSDGYVGVRMTRTIEQTVA